MKRDVNDRGLAEEKFRLAVEACPNGMVMFDGHGKTVMVNTEIERQFGYRRESLIGQPVDMLIPVWLRDRYALHREAVNYPPEVCRIGADPNLFGLRRNGSEFPIEVGLTPIRLSDGLLVLAVIVDVSERKDAEKHLAQMEGRYRGLLEAAPDAMVVVNQAGEIVLLNVQAEKQFGYRRDELLGQKVTNIIPDGFAERLIADALRSTEDALAQQIGTGIELTGRRKDGDEFPIEIMLSPLESPEGILITAAVRDISVRKQMERLKDDFVATVSHELRTPLTSISGSLGLLVGRWAGELPESAARLLTIAHTNSQRLVRLINDILDIEKIEFGRVVFKMGQIDVRTLVEQTIESNRGFAEGYEVRIRLDAGSVDGQVNADPDRLSQVVTNLLSNAIKFSPVNGEVLVTIEKDDNVIRISVHDQGTGVPADFKPHIFEKFAQADATSTRQKGGTGLGLSIAKQIVERLNGEMSFDDAVGGGTIFHVELPNWEGKADWEIDYGAATGAARILICEDDREIATVIRECLRQAGFAADFAYTAAAATDRSTVIAYAAFLIDLQLPDGDGVSLMVRLRAQKQYHDTPIIVISGNPGRGRADMRASQLNVLGWLSKPVDFEHLVEVVRASTASKPNRRPRILHVDDDQGVLAAVTKVLRTTADVVSVDSLRNARRVLAADTIDLAVLDVSLGTESGLDLLPSLRNSVGEAIPVIIFSANVACLACDGQIRVTLAKSDNSLEVLAETVRRRLGLTPVGTAEEVA